MRLDDVEDAARGQVARDDLGPALEIREPAEHAVGGEDHVEATGEGRRQVVEIALDEGRRHAHPRREGARRGDGLLREVHPGHGGAVPSPADGVHAEVALQVEQRLAADVARPRPGDRVEVAAAPRRERLDVVHLGAKIDPRPGVPEPAIGRAVPVHQSRRYTRRAVPANIACFSAAEAPATMRLNAFQSAAQPMPILSTGKLLSNRQRPGPKSSMPVSK